MKSCPFVAVACCVLLASEVLLAPLEPEQTGKDDQVPHESSLDLEEELRQQPKVNPAQVPDHPPASPPLLLQNGAISDEANTMLDSLSFEEIVEDVLSTLKKHPEILKELEEDEEQKTGIQIDDDDSQDSTNFQIPSPQLLQMPKRVEKKAGDRYYDAKRGGKHPGSYYKMKYGGSSSDESESDAKSSASSESEPSSSASSSSEESSQDSSSSDESSENYQKYIPQKREKELPEETIDLLSLPEGGSDVYAGSSKRFWYPGARIVNARTYRARAAPGSFRNPPTGEAESDTGNKGPILESPFINSLPLFLPGDLAGNQPAHLTEENQNRLEALAEMGEDDNMMSEEMNPQTVEDSEEERNAPIKDIEQLQSLENKERKKKEQEQKEELENGNGVDDSSKAEAAPSDTEEDALLALAQNEGSDNKEQPKRKRM